MIETEVVPVQIDRRKVDFGALTKEAQESHVDEILDQLTLGMISKDIARGLIMDITDDARVRESMTNLYDKSGLMLRLDEAIQISLEQGVPLSVMYADGDKFKEINDKISHAKGDEVIVAMAEGLKICTREYDSVAHLNPQETAEDHKARHIKLQEARPGGDEFVLVMLGVDLETAQGIGIRIQEYIAKVVGEKVPDLKEKLGYDFSVSIGLAQFDAEKDGNNISEKRKSAESLLNRADVALHDAKKARGVERV